MFSGIALALAFAVLLVPLAVYAGPPVLKALSGTGVERQAAVPSYQRPPAELTQVPFVNTLDPAAPMPDAAVLGALLDGELRFNGSGTVSAAVTDVRAFALELLGVDLMPTPRSSSCRPSRDSGSTSPRPPAGISR